MPEISDDRRDEWTPLARHNELIATPSAGDMLVYDTQRSVIHYLNPATYAVWAACDGTRTVADIRQAVSATLGVNVSTELVHLALSQLVTAELVTGTITTAHLHERPSRRSLIRRVAVTGGIVLPSLVSISAPVAADTHSLPCLNEGEACSEGHQCCTGYCPEGVCIVYVPPPPDVSACGQPCSSSADCRGVCSDCRDIGAGAPVPIFQCLPPL